MCWIEDYCGGYYWFCEWVVVCFVDVVYDFVWVVEIEIVLFVVWCVVVWCMDGGYVCFLCCLSMCMMVLVVFVVVFCCSERCILVNILVSVW